MRASKLSGLLLLVFASSALALVATGSKSRFDGYALPSPGEVIAVRAQPLGELPAADALRAGWEAFGTANGGWTVHLDQRSGLPTLAHGRGIPWIAGPGNDLAASGEDVLAQLERRARAFLDQHRVLLGTSGSELVLDREASGSVSGRLWFVTFRQQVNGVPVDGARFDFHVVQGNLVAFGADRFVAPRVSTVPRLDDAAARAELMRYLGSPLPGEVVEFAPASLVLIPVDPRPAGAGEWTGLRGEGLTHVLAWRFYVNVPGEEASWVAEVDAQRGTVIGFTNQTKYDRARGGVFPLASDGIGYEGHEQPGLPMPFTDIVNNGSTTAASNQGVYSCAAPGGAVTTTLAGPYVKIVDACGAVSETVLCGDVLELGTGSGTDTNCTVAPGASAGNTRASRTCFYHVNRQMELQRFWLPDNTWLKSQVQVNSNVGATCNASWGGQLNMYRAGNGCRNTCELSGVFSHELGHGLDSNDGGGYDDPTEAYADIVAIFQARESCVGRGFQDSLCSGYGDACLTCTGVRDEDWDQHASHAPATPQGFGTNNCSGGDGPCGKEQHCEARISSEALFDLATRDLPAKSGLDLASGWQVAERLWYQSRKGSGGNAYNCALPSSDGCGTNSWFSKLRVADDDDGNLANGTPHAAAIFAAFRRHNIACGAANDASNQNSTGCPALGAPALTVVREGSGLRLNWTAIANAASYRVYRNETGCDRSQVPIAVITAPATTFYDGSLAQGIDISYRVQAVGSNAACESAVSNCQALSYQPLTGQVSFSTSGYACGATLTVGVDDGNAAGNTLTVQLWSDAETAPETVTLNETAPGSGSYRGSFATTTGAPVHGDHALSVSAGSVITAEYRDANSASGGTALVYGKTVADCSTGAPGAVQVTDITDDGATIRWSTVETTSGRVEWGTTAALGNTANDPSFGTTHAVPLTGLAECGRVFFRVVAIDKPGNQSTLDAGGQPFAFNVGRIPGFFRDDFEGSSGWTLEGEWQINSPRGKGTNNPDPSSAFSGSKVLGHDLTGLGARPGDYEKSTNQRATSPNFNASTRTGVEIKFRRWLNTGQGAIAYVEVRNGGGTWNRVWSSNGTFGQRESAWSFQTIDISQFADGKAGVQVSFRTSAGTSDSSASSWNVDRFVVREASQPAGESCGACGGAPSFRGAASAVDGDPCSTGGGVLVSWDAAPAWGSGSTGTYSVYRDVVPGFAPSAANRIATGLAGTSYNDTAAANGTTYYYLVRAENDENCGTGPANNGVTDANTAYASVTPSSSQAGPASVPGLGIQQPIGNDLRLTWSAAGAPTYRVLRSATPLPAGFAPLGDTAVTSYGDAGAAADGASHFYLVKGVNACGVVGP